MLVHIYIYIYIPKHIHTYTHIHIHRYTHIYPLYTHNCTKYLHIPMWPMYTLIV